jgi:cytochrome c oxidase subunit 2
MTAPDPSTTHGLRPNRWTLERLARLLGGLLLLGVAGSLLVERLGGSDPSGPVIELVARQPAAGGWSRERIVVNRGERVRLRIRAEDVVHGFAIGRLGVDAGTIEPGKVKTVAFVADQAGEFTFYCTTWCDPNHPRMRGILEVRDPAGGPAPLAPSPRDVALQDLDMPREAPAIPPARPSAARGRPLFVQRCVACHRGRGQGTGEGPEIGHREFLQDRSPARVFQFLQEPLAGEVKQEHVPRSLALVRAVEGRPSHQRFSQGWTHQDRWDVVAYLWSLSTTPDRLDLGRRLYLKNCSACHGESGRGDGPGGRVQPKAPAKFAEPRTMLGGTSALYTAKIRRGGMGTGMPYWGSILTEEELAAVVDYLWTFSLGVQD